MTIEIERDLTRLAEHADRYGDVARAITTVRRRRRRRAIGVPALALLVAAAVIAVTALAPRHTARVPQGPVDPPVAFGIPPVVRAPAGAAALPVDRPAGAIGVVYSVCASGCPTYAVLGDGTQYRLDRPVGDVSLSPDGRWLAVTRADGTTAVRDLLGTGVWTVPATRVTAWSPGDRQAAGNGPDGSARRIDLTTGHAVELGAGPVIAVNDAGDTATYSPNPHPLGNAAPYIWIDWHRPTTTREQSFSAWTLLHPDEAVSVFSGELASMPFRAAFSPGGRIAISVYRVGRDGAVDTPPPYPRTAVVLGTVAGDGSISERVDLPARCGAPFFVQERLAYPTQASRTAPIIVYAELGSGFAELTRLPATAVYLIAGAAGPTSGPA